MTIRFQIEHKWVHIKRLAALTAVWAFGIAAFLAFGAVVVQWLDSTLEWLKSGQWRFAGSIAETFSPLTAYVANMEWVGAQRIAQWIISQSVLWVWVLAGIAGASIAAYFKEVADDCSFELGQAHTGHPGLDSAEQMSNEGWSDEGWSDEVGGDEAWSDEVWGNDEEDDQRGPIEEWKDPRY